MEIQGRVRNRNKETYNTHVESTGSNAGHTLGNQLQTKKEPHFIEYLKTLYKVKVKLETTKGYAVINSATAKVTITFLVSTGNMATCHQQKIGLVNV